MTTLPLSAPTTLRCDNGLDPRLSPERMFPFAEDVSEITLVCPRADYSASLIARAVEDCDAHLLNLNVTADTTPAAGSVVVELRVNRRDPSLIARSLARYGYEVADTRAADGSAITDEKAIDRFRELIRRLEV